MAYACFVVIVVAALTASFSVAYKPTGMSSIVCRQITTYPDNPTGLAGLTRLLAADFAGCLFFDAFAFAGFDCFTFAMWLLL